MKNTFEQAAKVAAPIIMLAFSSCADMGNTVVRQLTGGYVPDFGGNRQQRNYDRQIEENPRLTPTQKHYFEKQNAQNAEAQQNYGRQVQQNQIIGLGETVIQRLIHH
jgi:hypothetical protein